MSFAFLAAVIAPGSVIGAVHPLAASEQRALPRADRIGVERIVIACRADAGAGDDVRERLCEALLRGARARSALPVMMDDADPDAVPDGRGRHDLRLVARAAREAGTLHVTLQLVRHAFIQGAETTPREQVALAATAGTRALDAALIEPLNRLFPAGERRAGDALRQH